MINFVLVSNKRTGSTFLQESINSHPDIKCFDELFLIRAKNIERVGEIPIYRKMHKDKDFTPKEYIGWLKAEHGKLGFKVVYPQLDYWKELTDNIIIEDVPVIHLIRQNYFEQSMSWFTKNIPNREKIYIDPKQMKQRIDRISENTDYYRNLFKNNKKYMEVYYEDMFGEVRGKKVKVRQKGSFNIRSKQKTFLSYKYKESLNNFLNLREEDLFSNISKRTDWNVWKYIENQDEIKQLLRENNWDHFIRENK